MSSNGTLTYYDNQIKKFKTVFIHHIETNDSHEINSLSLLNKYYRKDNEARSLIDNGFLSHFNKKNVIKGADENYIISSSIEELKKLTSSFSSTNYIYFLGYWYPNPIDVENIFFKHDNYINHFEETGYYDLNINTFNFFISKESKKQNMNISKIVIIEEYDKPILVLCMELSEVVSYSLANQISDIYKTLTNENELLKKAKWYSFSSESVEPFLDYQLSKVNFDENNSPTWNKNISWIDISKNYKVEGFENLLISISSQI